MNRDAHLYAFRKLIFAAFFFSVGATFAVIAQAVIG